MTPFTMGRMRFSVPRANSQTDSYTDDALGEMTSQTDKNGRVTDYTFNHDGQMTQEQWMSGGTAIYTATFAVPSQILIAFVAEFSV